MELGKTDIKIDVDKTLPYICEECESEFLKKLSVLEKSLDY